MALTVTHRLRLRAAVVLALTLTLLGIPAMAQAAFTAYAGAAMPVSTATIPAPTTAVTVICQAGTVSIDVSPYTPVAFANRHEIQLFDVNNKLIQKKNLLGPDGGDIQLSGGRGQYSGWKFELRGYYDVPGTTNTWTGAPLPGTVTCT
ncbi:hypothetical protein [Arthrobacter mangrovi]|uniref:Uncharacterized protein n=1 Tax=Arthrobacter mangrovi TaxID=2966350 RepID=A0ABQ5MVS3_9MICC|nr:hypothetical protein [Arthrobacter mangrovi]GLB67900.1 hypothetical protein AHIS1636_23400 [Arthrobacter mangrovi]